MNNKDGLLADSIVVAFRGSRYECSENGRVVNANTGRELKQKTKSLGYKEVCLYIKGEKKSFYVHRIVAECFVENKDKKPEVNHIDGDKSNNKSSNLEWCTSSENQLHAFKSGLQKPTRLLGVDHGMYKGVISCKNLKTDDVFKMRSLTDCHKYGFTSSSVSKVINNQLKTHKSHIFWREDNE